MNEEENFVARWSRLKRAKSQEQSDLQRTEPPQAPSDGEGDPAEDRPAVVIREQDPATPFDASQLPSIDSLTENSDIRAFLQPGVPRELTKAALRKVWATDPAIRDFIGIAENQWDFTDPTAIPGFGPLEARDNVAELVAQAMGGLRQEPEVDVGAIGPTSDRPATATEERQQPSAVAEKKTESPAIETPLEAKRSGESDAVQHDHPPTEAELVVHRRTHGRALPR
jgi:hypothetical protein